MTILSEKEQSLLGRLIDNFLKLSLEDQQYILGRTEEKAEQARSAGKTDPDYFTKPYPAAAKRHLRL